jgi:hypothetical protein
MDVTPPPGREECIEQAYFFRTWRERLVEGRPSQDSLEHLAREILGTTRLARAVEFLLAELKHTGELGAAFLRLQHYFSPFQTHVIRFVEREENFRFTYPQALLILEREAVYRSGDATPAGLFIYELEAISRNRLGYLDGLKAMEGDGTFPPEWRRWITKCRRQLDVRDFADLIYFHSEQLVEDRRANDPDFVPPYEIIFSGREGRIASANRGTDPHHLFSTLQRQLGYPEVPRLPRVNPADNRVAEMERRIKILENKVTMLEGEIGGSTDLSPFLAKPPG